MIRQKMMLKTYPSKTVLEDVATRSGPPESDSFTPFIGKQNVLREQFCGSQAERFSIDGFLIENASFEFDPAKRNEKKTVGIMELEERDEKQFLEDFMDDGKESESVLKWFIEACISYKKRKGSSYRQQDYTYASISYGDDDSVLDPRMIDTVKDDYGTTQEEYDLALRKLPFYIKAIWAYSRAHSANLFSFIAAYMDMLKNKRKTRNEIIVNYFAEYPLYMFKKGTCTYYRQFDHESDIKTARYKEVTDIFCYPDKHKEEMTLVNNFMDVCEILGINFEKQDTMVFTDELINKMICTYIPTNAEYMKFYGEIDAEILYAIKSNNLYSKTKLDIYSDPNNSVEVNSRRENLMDYETRLKILYQTYDMFPDKSIRNLFLGSEELAIKNINELVYYTTGKRVDLSPALDFKGFLVKSKKDGEPIALKTEALGPYAGVPSYEVLVTVNGAFILHKYDADDTVYIPAESVITTLEENVNAGRKQNRWCSI